MDSVALLGLLVLGLVVLTPVSDRIGVPQPVVLTIYGLLLGIVPFVPSPQMNPERVLPLVLPPLLFAATQNTSVRELRAAARSILGLSVGLTLVTAVAVTLVGHALGLPWAVAAVLGAVVSPPDPVAATAVASRLRLPPRLVNLLEGEGQFNDDTALVLYQLSVMAVVAGGVTIAEVGLGLLVAIVGGVLIGFVGGWLTRRALQLLHDAATETTVTLAVPFALYLVADEIGASGVLAVLVAGLYLRATLNREVTSAGWLLGRSVWRYVEFAVSGILFAFLGVELTKVFGSTHLLDDAPTLKVSAAVIGALLVVLVTLVVQGLTLAPLIRGLGVASDADVQADARRLHRQVAEAGLEHLRQVDDANPAVRAAVMQQYESRLRYRRQVEGLVDGNTGGEEAGPQLRDLLAETTEAEREAVMEARRTGEVSSAAADEVMFDVEARSLRYES